MLDSSNNENTLNNHRGFTKSPKIQSSVTKSIKVQNEVPKQSFEKTPASISLQNDSAMMSITNNTYNVVKSLSTKKSNIKSTDTKENIEEYTEDIDDATIVSAARDDIQPRDLSKTTTDFSQSNDTSQSIDKTSDVIFPVPVAVPTAVNKPITTAVPQSLLRPAAALSTNEYLNSIKISRRKPRLSLGEVMHTIRSTPSNVNNETIASNLMGKLLPSEFKDYIKVFRDGFQNETGAYKQTLFMTRTPNTLKAMNANLTQNKPNSPRSHLLQFFIEHDSPIEVTAKEPAKESLKSPTVLENIIPLNTCLETVVSHPTSIEETNMFNKDIDAEAVVNVTENATECAILTDYVDDDEVDVFSSSIYNDAATWTEEELHKAEEVVRRMSRKSDVSMKPQFDLLLAEIESLKDQMKLQYAVVSQSVNDRNDLQARVFDLETKLELTKSEREAIVQHSYQMENQMKRQQLEFEAQVMKDSLANLAEIQNNLTNRRKLREEEIKLQQAKLEKKLLSMSYERPVINLFGGKEEVPEEPQPRPARIIDNVDYLPILTSSIMIPSNRLVVPKPIRFEVSASITSAFQLFQKDVDQAHSIVDNKTVDGSKNENDFLDMHEYDGVDAFDDAPCEIIDDEDDIIISKPIVEKAIDHVVTEKENYTKQYIQSEKYEKKVKASAKPVRLFEEKEDNDKKVVVQRLLRDVSNRPPMAQYANMIFKPISAAHKPSRFQVDATPSPMKPLEGMVVSPTVSPALKKRSTKVSKRERIADVSETIDMKPAKKDSRTLKSPRSKSIKGSPSVSKIVSPTKPIESVSCEIDDNHEQDMQSSPVPVVKKMPRTKKMTKKSWNERLSLQVKPKDAASSDDKPTVDSKASKLQMDAKTVSNTSDVPSVNIVSLQSLSSLSNSLKLSAPIISATTEDVDVDIDLQIAPIETLKNKTSRCKKAPKESVENKVSNNMTSPISKVKTADKVKSPLAMQKPKKREKVKASKMFVKNTNPYDLDILTIINI